MGVKQLKRIKDPEVFSARFFYDRKRGVLWSYGQTSKNRAIDSVPIPVEHGWVVVVADSLAVLVVEVNRTLVWGRDPVV